MSRADLARLADRIWSAREAVSTLAREDFADLAGLDDAYGVQTLNLRRQERLGRRRSGWKVGFTSAAVREQLGVAEPMYGVLFENMDVSGRDLVTVDDLVSPRIEAEIAFVLARDVPAGSPPDVVLGAVGYACVAAEIVDTIIEGWRLGLDEAVADNAAAARYALSPHRIDLCEFDPSAAAMRMWRNGEVCSRGRGADCMGDPRRSLLWLAEAAGGRGEDLQAGDVVLSGALGAMSDVRAGDVFSIDVDNQPRLTVHFGEG
jgi:2-keto-4-pentenoate hydratase